MPVRHRPSQPKISWVPNDAGSNLRESYLQNPGDSVTLTCQLSEAFDKAVRVRFVPLPGSGLLEGVDYEIDDTTQFFQPGETELTVKVTLLDNPKFRKTRTLSLICRERLARGARGEYAHYNIIMYGTAEPPTVTLGTAAESQTGAGTKTLPVTLSAVSDEDTVVPFTFGGTLTKDTEYTISAVSGGTWNNTDDTLTIPAGTTVARIEAVFDGTVGNAQIRLASPTSNVQRNLMTYSNFVPEGGTAVNETPTTDGVTVDPTAWPTDDAIRKSNTPSDWAFGCDDANLGFSSLQETVEDVVLPDGTTGPCLFAAPRTLGADPVAAFGCIRKSFTGSLHGAYDYAGTLGTNENGDLRNVVHPQAGLQAGHNIFSCYMKRASAPSGYTLATHSSIQILNRSKQAGISDDPNDKDHRLTVVWSGATPSLESTDNADFYDIEDVGNDWWRLSVVYNAPPEAAGDTTNWFARPCDHPTDNVSLHIMEGVWVWGAQYEIDVTRTLQAPTAYQKFEEETWFAGTSIMGAVAQTEVTVA